MIQKWLTLMMLKKNSWSSIQNINNWRLKIWKKTLFNLIIQQPDIKFDQIWSKRGSTGLKHLNGSKDFN